MSMKKKGLIGVLVGLLIVAFTGVAFGTSSMSNYSRFPGGITIDEVPVLNSYAGDVYWVDNEKGSDGNKGTFARPWKTVDYAIGRCTANNGDIIMVKPGHAENLALADAIDADVAGILICGVGAGSDMPTFTYTDTAGEFVIGAANVTLYNLRFAAGISAITMGISVEAAGDNFTLKGCVFPKPTTNSFEFLDAIDIADGADNISVLNCEYYNDEGGAAPNHFIEAGNGTAGPEKLRVIGCYIKGDFAVSAIWSDEPCDEAYIVGNTIINHTADQHCVEFTDAGTGVIAYNTFYSSAEATTLDPGSMSCVENYVTTANDASGQLVPAPDTGISSLNVTTLDAVQAEAEDAIEADDLDHLLIVAAGASAAYPANVTTKSIISYIMADDGVIANYDMATDSLEAISNALLAGTGATAAIDADGLDHLVTTADGTGAYPASVAQESILAYIMGDDATAVVTTFDNSTDSLEALGTKTTDIDTNVDIISAAASPSYSHPNYLTVTADMTSGTWNTVAAHEIAAVTGAVRMQVMIETVATIVTVGTSGTLALGVAGNTAAVMAATALDAAVTGDVWTAVYGSVATTVVGVADASSALTSAIQDIVVINGIDVGYTIAVGAGTTGSLKFHIWWTPLDSNGNVTAGEGGAF